MSAATGEGIFENALREILAAMRNEGAAIC